LDAEFLENQKRERKTQKKRKMLVQAEKKTRGPVRLTKGKGGSTGGKRGV